MKVQDVMLQAMAKKITWWQAAEILGISDRRRGKPSSRRVPVATVEKVFALYRERPLSRKLWLRRDSWGGLEAGLEQDVELGEGGAKATAGASPAALLEGRDEQSEF